MWGANPHLPLAAGFTRSWAGRLLPLEKISQKQKGGIWMDLMQANAVVRDELMKHGDYYTAFIASVESALNECDKVTDTHELAVLITDRLSGER